jgi:hypothetical protein
VILRLLSEQDQHSLSSSMLTKAVQQLRHSVYDDTIAADLAMLEQHGLVVRDEERHGAKTLVFATLTKLGRDVAHGRPHPARRPALAEVLIMAKRRARSTGWTRRSATGSAACRDQGRTLDEIIAKLRRARLRGVAVALGVASSSAGRRTRSPSGCARAAPSPTSLCGGLGDAEPDKATRLNIELMHQAVFDMLSTDGEDGEPVTLEPMQVMLMAKALDHLGKASKDDVARTVAIERRAADQGQGRGGIKQAEAAVVKHGGAGALTPELQLAFKAMLFGQSNG